MNNNKIGLFASLVFLSVFLVGCAGSYGSLKLNDNHSDLPHPKDRVEMTPCMTDARVITVGRDPETNVGSAGRPILFQIEECEQSEEADGIEGGSFI